MVEEGQWSDALCGYESTAKEEEVVPLQHWLEPGGLYAEPQV